MLKRILIILISIAAFAYVFSGYYFYKKGVLNRIAALNNPAQIIPDTTKLIQLKDTILDFEIDAPEKDQLLSTTYSFEGKNSLKIIPEKEYSGEVVLLLSALKTLNFVREVEVSFMAYSKNKINKPVLWVFEIIADDGKVLAWESNGILPSAGEWQNYNFRFKLKQNILNAKYKLKTYAWNKNKETLYIDNLHVSFLGFGKLEY